MSEIKTVHDSKNEHDVPEANNDSGDQIRHLLGPPTLKERSLGNFATSGGDFFAVVASREGSRLFRGAEDDHGILSMNQIPVVGETLFRGSGSFYRSEHGRLDIPRPTDKSPSWVNTSSDLRVPKALSKSRFNPKFST